MRQQFKNLDTWRGKLTATWVSWLRPPPWSPSSSPAASPRTRSSSTRTRWPSRARTRSSTTWPTTSRPSPVSTAVCRPRRSRRSRCRSPARSDGPVQPIPGITGDTSGIPGTVLAAYQKAANDLALAMPGCHITWPLLAGIGKVESAHASGGRVEPNGNTRGKILGPVLDGGPGMAAITDTDQGLYDGNTAWDRAVGPMQFIPGTWKVFGADGNGDGVKDPHNVFDAARAAGDYLCSGGANLSDPQGLVQAVLRYNHSMDYVSTVLRWMQSYSNQTVTIPDTEGIITAAGRQRQRGPVEQPDPDGHHHSADDRRRPRRRRRSSRRTPTTSPTRRRRAAGDLEAAGHDAEAADDATSPKPPTPTPTLRRPHRRRPRRRRRLRRRRPRRLPRRRRPRRRLPRRRRRRRPTPTPTPTPTATPTATPTRSRARRRRGPDRRSTPDQAPQPGS